MRRTELGPCTYTIDNVLSPEECEQIIKRTEAEGFEIATINTARGAQVVAEMRNNDRVIVDDHGLAADLWSRVREAVPAVLYGRQAVALNERFRFYRYVPGQRFSWHSDGPFRRENGELSQLTFMIYLNDGYKGGDTRFEKLRVRGRVGMALVFAHGLIHEGSEVTEGVKYVLRSDVMYGPVGRLAG
jgi:predicted 2-oxoglutarate/Fe(II)-dependent dioxygenase YbiX